MEEDAHIESQSNLKENLQRLLDASSLRASDLAEATHIPASTIKYILSGNTYNPRVETLLLIANFFNITIDELYKGIPNPPKNPPLIQLHHSPSPIDNSNHDFIKIPILSWKKVKNWFSPQHEEDMEVKWLNIGQRLHPHSFALEIDTEGKVIFPKHSLIIIEPKDQYKEDDFVIVSINKNIPTLRKVFEDSGQLYLKSIVALLPPEKLAPPHLIWGKVIECRTPY